MTKKSKAEQVKSNKRKGRNYENRELPKLGFTPYGLYGNMDGFDTVWDVECKNFKSSKIHTIMEQALKNCRSDKRPLLMIHRTNLGYEHDIIAMERKDFEEILKILRRSVLYKKAKK